MRRIHSIPPSPSPSMAETDTSTPSPTLPLLKPPLPPASSDPDLSSALRSLEAFFAAFGFYLYSSPRRSAFSWSLFLLLGVLAPVSVYCLHRASFADSSVPRIFAVDLAVPLSQTLLAVASLGCVGHNLRKYGMKRFLFVDKRYEEQRKLHKEYVSKIKLFYLISFFWVLPCIMVKAAHVVVRVFYVYNMSMATSVFILVASLMSWTYLTVVFLSGCGLFSLMCNLQVVHFEDYRELLECGADVSVLMEEHMRICFYLSKISHRFRLQLLMVFFISILSQFVTLLRTTQYKGVVSFINAGDFIVCSVVQVIGIVICLNAATRISHRAQNISSFASKWHALCTCRGNDNIQFTEDGNPKNSSWGSNHGSNSVHTVLATKKSFNSLLQSSYLQREALVMYLQSNSGGITIYGWTVDRGLITTLVCTEISLVCFIFSGSL